MQGKSKATPGNANDRSFQERLYAVALELFWEKGYRATSTRDIASALGVKQASLYYHVKKKEDVLYAICYSSLQQVFQGIRSALQGASDPVDGIRRILGAHLEQTLAQQKQFFVSIADYRSLSEQRIEEIKLFWRDYQELVSSILDRGKETGLIREDISNKYLYHVPISTVNWTVLWYRSAGPLGIQELEAMYSSVLVEGALAPEVKGSKRISEIRKKIYQVPHEVFDPIKVGINPTHARLMDTASTLFARRGFSTTSIREIAEAMNIEKASLYYYLSSKEDLIYDICRLAHQHLLESVTSARAGATNCEDQLYRVIFAHVMSLLQHQDWHAAANEQLSSLEEERRNTIVAMRDAYERQIRQMIEATQQIGLIRRDVSAKVLGLVLLGMLTHIYPWYEAGKDPTPEKLAAIIADLFLTGIWQAKL